MSLLYKTPEEIAEQYLLHLKGLKPEINTSQTDSDWWVRSRVVGGVLSGMYADQKKISNDAFPQSARHEAIEAHLETYFNSGFIQATQSEGNLLVSGATGSTVGVGTQFIYDPNGNTYSATETVLFGSAATAQVPVQSVNAGQSQNLLSGAQLTLPSPPAGVDNTATADGNISDGRDDETDTQAVARILAFIRNPIAGGKKSDYEQFAFQASPSVTGASVARFPFGLGTVGVYITAGTADIDTALDNGDAIVLFPSAELIAEVQAYIDAVNPLTDCAFVDAPASTTVNVTVNVKYTSGTGATVPGGQTLTQEELVIREVQRAIYKTPVGGRLIGGVGYVLASEIEEVMDINLSAGPYLTGEKAQILADRQCENLDGLNQNLLLSNSQLAIPGTITVVEM